MSKKIRVLTGAAIIAFAVVLSGCEMGKSSAESQEVLVSERPGVTIKGVLTSAGNLFYIKEGTKTTEVTSKKVDLKSKVGTTVEVYGEFSGTTLYVDEIK